MEKCRFENFRVGDYLDDHAENYPDRPAVRDSRAALSYAELKEAVDNTARAMHAAGVKTGDRVAMLAPPRVEALITFFAAAKLGVIWLGLNPKYQLNELDYIVSDAKPSLLFSIDTLDGRNYRNEVATLRENHPGIRLSIGLDAAGSYEADFQEWIKSGPVTEDLVKSLAAVPLNTPALLVYTSGSSGKPKGVMLGQRELLKRSRTQNNEFPVKPYPRVLNPLPINHIGGMHFLSLYTFVGAGTITLAEKFQPDEFISAMALNSVNIVFILPTMFQMIANRPAYSPDILNNLQWFVFSGAAMPSEFVDQLFAVECGVGLTYGMTETCGSVTYEKKTGSNQEVLCNTIGHSTPSGEVRVMHSDERECAPGESGEIQVRAKYCMRGYFNRPEATKETYTEDGWLKTGDIARMREDGNIEFVGRMSEMFKSGGYNVYPREIELALEEHPDIQLAAVIGIPDRLYAEVGWAFVIPRSGAEMDKDMMKAWCAERLANYKIPKQFVFSAELPMLPIGKVDKTRLKRETISAIS
ncbi:MAG: long-chain fatty acid--CoA ligase [Alphaproteobacteria bacterium]|nr:MAG: long-chain fatty acid--CoA ligase [Alphaproteobacteria bacterium]